MSEVCRIEGLEEGQQMDGHRELPMKRWTAERIEEVGWLWAEGLSARQIASRLGASRNAVILRVRAMQTRERLRTDAIGRGNAEKVALELLKDNLSATQREQYEKHGYFDAMGGKTGMRYRIRERRHVVQLYASGEGRLAVRLGDSSLW